MTVSQLSVTQCSLEVLSEVFVRQEQHWPESSELGLLAGIEGRFVEARPESASHILPKIVQVFMRTTGKERTYL